MPLKPKIATYLQVTDIATALSCSKDLVYQMIEDGLLEGIKLGKKAIRVSQSSYETFLETHKMQ